MPEGGLSPSEVGKEISEHSAHSRELDHESERRDRIMAIIEASLLAIVAVMAAWSGYASAKWGTDSRLAIAKSSSSRVQASNAELAALNQRNFDSSTFTVWFIAYVAGDAKSERVAVARFTPNFRRAFNAWIATNPGTNPHAAPGPTYMPQYQQPGLARASALSARATHLFNLGEADATNSDDYVRVTVYLATVLFLVAISGHFRQRGVRIGLIVVGSAILLVSVVDLASLPLPKL
jgi:hypothetical protein